MPGGHPVNPDSHTPRKPLRAAGRVDMMIRVSKRGQEYMGVYEDNITNETEQKSIRNQSTGYRL